MEEIKKECLYYIETKNKHNQILIFETMAEAVEWASKATTWTPERKAKEIKRAPRAWQGFFAIFPEKGKN